MRASVFAILLAALPASLAPPAADAHGGGFHSGGHVVFHFHSRGFARFGFPFNNNAFAFNNGVGFSHRGFGRGAFGSGAVLGGVASGITDQSYGQAPGVVVVPAPAPTPAARLADERPSIETTPQGVTIIRGPGSLHIAR